MTLSWRSIGALRVGRELSARVTVPPKGTREALGLNEHELADFARTYRFRELAQELPIGVDPVQVRRMAWWGSAFGDAALTAAGAERDVQVLLEAALFNLCVSVFDSVLDQRLPVAPTLVEALAPETLRGRLQNLRAENAPLRCHESSVSRLVGLIDAMITSMGLRLEDHPTRLQECLNLLARMYASEVHGTPDALEAKHLPIRFIGSLAVGPRPAARLFDPLARFFATWDDWADLETDLLNLQANYFLAPNHPRTRQEKAWYFIRSFPRVVGDRVTGRRPLAALVRALEETLRAAKVMGSPTDHKVACLCLQVLG